MNHDEVLAAYDRQVRRGAVPDGPRSRIEFDGGVVRQVGPAHGWNGVLWSELDDDTADAAIQAQLAYFTGLGLGLEWKLYAHDRPADLGRRLLAAGFAAEDEEALMVAAAAELPHEAELPDGVRLQPVTDAAGVDLMTRVHELAFGTDATDLRRQLLDRLGDDDVIAVVAMAGDEPISSARMELHPGTDFAGLWGGGTVDGWRGRGLYRALVAYRARIAVARGYRYLQVDASDMSRPILARLGFARLSTTTPYLFPGG
ncbi:GNAT family N-acetyltransferase [Nonomuraea sp. NN258]|uniref:GNAT family N-acetyltransferase n=1 Tax=Nonomuraea antri TaxID=2730852 RepID=UPI0015685BA8|nr:GNAT family N-acetyltransferase [Nonomuraea antri]NRQ40346.1 GNAT family N-acetyltransferase [Nonomuraea antri]